MYATLSLVVCIMYTFAIFPPRKNNQDHGKEKTLLLANLEHELRVPRNSIWLCLAGLEHVAHFSNLRSRER